MVTAAASDGANAWRAALCMVAASCLFAGFSALAKYLMVSEEGSGVGAIQITFIRYVFGSLFLAPFLYVGRVMPRTIHGPKYALRAAAGVAAVILMFIAFQTIPLADATAISFSSPIFTMILSIMLLDERSSAQRWFAAGLGFAGVVVIAAPDAGIFATGSLIAVAAAIVMGAEVTVVKWLSSLGDRPIVMLFLGNLFSAILVCPFAIPGWQWIETWQWLMIAALTLLAITGQRLVLVAMALADAGFVAPFFYATLVFAGLFGMLLFDEVPRMALLLGSALIIGSGILLARFDR